MAADVEPVAHVLLGPADPPQMSPASNTTGLTRRTASEARRLPGAPWGRRPRWVSSPQIDRPSFPRFSCERIMPPDLGPWSSSNAPRNDSPLKMGRARRDLNQWAPGVNRHPSDAQRRLGTTLSPGNTTRRAGISSIALDWHRSTGAKSPPKMAAFSRSPAGITSVSSRCRRVRRPRPKRQSIDTAATSVVVLTIPTNVRGSQPSGYLRAGVMSPVPTETSSFVESPERDQLCQRGRARNATQCTCISSSRMRCSMSGVRELMPYRPKGNFPVQHGTSSPNASQGRGAPRGRLLSRYQ